MNNKVRLRRYLRNGEDSEWTCVAQDGGPGIDNCTWRVAHSWISIILGIPCVVKKPLLIIPEIRNELSPPPLLGNRLLRINSSPPRNRSKKRSLFLFADGCRSKKKLLNLFWLISPCSSRETITSTFWESIPVFQIAPAVTLFRRPQQAIRSPWALQTPNPFLFYTHFLFRRVPRLTAETALKSCCHLQVPDPHLRVSQRSDTATAWKHFSRWGSIPGLCCDYLTIINRTRVADILEKQCRYSRKLHSGSHELKKSAKN